MKKICLLVLASVLCLHAFPADKLIKYQGEASFGYGFGLTPKSGNDANLRDKSNLQLINGIRIGKYFAVGIGIGVDCCGKSKLDDETKWGFSTFGNFKGYLPVSSVTSLFVSTDIGGGWGPANSLGARNGVIVVPALGASFKVSPKSAINVSLAYTHQGLGKNKCDFLYNYDALGFKVGFQF